jgi:hypothetical protein
LNDKAGGEKALSWPGPSVVCRPSVVCLFRLPFAVPLIHHTPQETSAVLTKMPVAQHVEQHTLCVPAGRKVS